MGRREWAMAGAAAVILAVCLACGTPPTPPAQYVTNGSANGPTVVGRVSSREMAIAQGTYDSGIAPIQLDTLPPASRVARNWDEFRRVTSLEYEAQIDYRTDLFVRGVPDAGDVAILSFMSSYSEWRFLHCHAVDILADEQPVPLPTSDHEGRTREHGVMEFVRVTVPLATIERLAAARSLRMRVCNDVFVLHAAQIATLQTFLAQWREIAGARAEELAGDAGAPAAASTDAGRRRGASRAP